MTDYTLHIMGGIGKHITATAFIRWLKEHEPDSKITIISAWPEVFMQNPHIHRNLHHNTSYLFDDYIDGTEFRTGEPYSRTEYFKHEKHVAELWPMVLGFNEYNKNIKPEIYYVPQELQQAQKMLGKVTKPIISVQFDGGNQVMNKELRDNTKRDFNRGQFIVDKLLAAGFIVLHIRLPQEVQYKGTISFNTPFRMQLCFLPYIVAHIGIDSSYMHAVAATSKPALILWQSTNVNNLGYPWMKNIINKGCPTPMCGRPHLGHINDVVPGSQWICPHNHRCNVWNEEQLTKIIDEFIEELKNNGQPKKEIELKPETGQDRLKRLPVQGLPNKASKVTKKNRLKKKA